MNQRKNNVKYCVTSGRKRTKKQMKLKVNSHAKDRITPPHVVIENKSRVIAFNQQKDYCSLILSKR